MTLVEEWIVTTVVGPSHRRAAVSFHQDRCGATSRECSRPSTAVKALFEHTLDTSAVRCIERLQELGDYAYDLSPGETWAMNLGRLVSSGEIIDALTSLARRKGEPSGDVYAVLVK